MEYYVSKQPGHYVFYIYKHKKSYGAKLRILIGVPNDDTYLAGVLFHERFYISMTAHPKMVDSPPLLHNTTELCNFIENALKNGTGTTTIKQFLYDKVYFWDESSNALDGMPPLIINAIDRRGETL